VRELYLKITPSANRYEIYITQVYSSLIFIPATETSKITKHAAARNFYRNFKRH
jgi:hypothetical protein